MTQSRSGMLRFVLDVVLFFALLSFLKWEFGLTLQCEVCGEGNGGGSAPSRAGPFIGVAAAAPMTQPCVQVS